MIAESKPKDDRLTVDPTMTNQWSHAAVNEHMRADEIVTEIGVRTPPTRLSATKPHRKTRRGAAMVEFAIVAPLLFFFFFAAFEFCRVAMIRHTVDNAVYEGCRSAIIPGATAGDARDTAENVLATLGLSGAVITVSPSTIDNQTPELTMTIEVSVNANTFVPPQFAGGKKITRTLTMQREGANL